MALDPSLRVRLTARTRAHFTGSTLFDEIARTVCDAECLPRKELYESWEAARRIRRETRGGRVVDLACGHGLLAAILMLLDDTIPAALAVDTRLPASAHRLQRVLVARWPRLSALTLVEDDLANVALASSDLVVSVHACGALTDTILARAADARARVAVVPCCHALGPAEDQPFSSWTDGALAMDMRRAFALEARGYRVRARAIPAEITPKNRLLVGLPRAD